MLNEIAAAVRENRVHPAELVAEAIGRIESLDGDINSVIELHAEEALAEAKASPGVGPLAGVPFLMKDLGDLRGFRTTFGSKLHENAEPAVDDHHVAARLREAGAIPIGKTNTPEFGFVAVTNNPLFGHTNNPWNLERTPGGSSGGAAAALAAGLVPLATSSDGGGSVRIPASLCGLVGYKPTNGAIPRPAAPPWIDFSTWGATGFSVADVITEVAVYLNAGANATAPSGDPAALPPGSIDLAPRLPKRALLVPTLRAGIEPAFDRAVRDAAAALEVAGVIVEEADNPIPGAVFSWFIAAAAELANHLHSNYDDSGVAQLSDELQAYVEFGLSISLADYLGTRRQRFDYTRTLDTVLGSDTVLLTATTNVESWAPQGPMPTSLGDLEDPSIVVNTPEFNLTGHPGVSAPIGRDSAGVPFGLQVIAPRWNDGLALGVAATLEQQRPWATIAPGYAPFPIG